MVMMVVMMMMIDDGVIREHLLNAEVDFSYFWCPQRRSPSPTCQRHSYPFRQIKTSQVFPHSNNSPEQQMGARGQGS